MLITLTVLFLVLLLILVFTANDELAIAAGFFFFVFFVISILVGTDVANGRIIDSKIEMYSEENKNIETEINTLVGQYMDYESITYGELKGDNSITLVSLYPELKSDVLVTKQIEIYVANNEKIKELKEEKIELSIKKWWLYFGH